MSAMMAVLKMFHDRQSTYVSVLTALQQVQNEQRKWKKHARKYGKELRAVQNEIGGFMDALETRRQQFVHAVRERDANHDQIMQLTHEQDDAIRLAQTRNNARVMAEIRAEVRENELLYQFEEPQIDVHRLNNQINQIPNPIPVYPVVGGPLVIFTDDDGMELDANVIVVPKAEEEEELDLVQDEDGGVMDADTNEDVQFSYSTKLDALVRIFYFLLEEHVT